MDDMMQSRERTGAQQRAGHRPHEVIEVIRRARLTAADRVAVLEHLESAITADRREDLGGARHLTRARQDLDTPPRLGPVLGTLAGRFVKPPRP
jgi:hypothetical protein